MKDMQGKNVLITGAGSGIGEALAYEFAVRRANLLLLGRRVSHLEKVKQECERLGGQAAIYCIDLADEASMTTFVDSLRQTGQLLDYLVLNAGVSQRALTLDTDFQVDKTIMQVNYFAPVFLVKSMKDLLLRSASVHIVVTSSISGLFGFPLRSAYCASKHALFGFFESLELEYPNIRTTFLIPGRICTAISQSALLSDGSAYNQMDAGQATGMPVDKCARIAIRAIEKKQRRRLIGGKELLMVYIKQLCPKLFFKLARNISAT